MLHQTHVKTHKVTEFNAKHPEEQKESSAHLQTDPRCKTGLMDDMWTAATAENPPIPFHEQPSVLVHTFLKVIQVTV